jgi:hypothetical protein
MITWNNEPQRHRGHKEKKREKNCTGNKPSLIPPFSLTKISVFILICVYLRLSAVKKNTIFSYPNPYPHPSKFYNQIRKLNTT